MAEGRVGFREEVINRACSIAMEAHKYPTRPYLSEVSMTSPEVVLGFAGSWQAHDWYAHMPFGETTTNLHLFPSLKTVREGTAAIVNKAFLQRFEAILSQSQLRNEVEKAAAEKRQIVFTGHSSGAPMAIFATLWFLERTPKENNHFSPYCLTFGSPLIGNRILAHALGRKKWSHLFTHFVSRYDIVPRIFLTPLSSIQQELQPILHYFNPKSTIFQSESISRARESSYFFETVMRNTAMVASHAACKLMGCTNLLLETLTSFVELSPYKPFGTYVFCTGNGRLVVVENPDAIMQLLFYSMQLASEEELDQVSKRCLEEHLTYESELRESLGMQSLAYMDHLEKLPLTADGEGENAAVTTALSDLGMSASARLCLRAAGELKRHKERNLQKVDNYKNKINDGLSSLERYRARCMDHGLCYYDAFKLQREDEDFHRNVNRLDLAGLWDKIVEMVKRYELPDDFEEKEDWVELGTQYRRIVEPLDIANYYRHLKNEDTGPYMINGRPRRYKYIQRWLEHAEAIQPESIPDSCFWAEVEELSIVTSNGNAESFDDIKERVLQLEENVLQMDPKWATPQCCAIEWVNVRQMVENAAPPAQIGILHCKSHMLTRKALFLLP
ncbi:hypothetical protein Nepgr_023293 [Nepenthes gracilis]|uniref:Uncharacterized protein n=1 Tax=Nepenthes gracilis TaxID=150966 RepID=A0AAD3XZ92_NEPGR|nr:hypothetical protein Nepgr_023293 [Nepenthes gracilis]